MLVSNTLRYALARGAAGLLNFLSLVIFTRLLGREGYGAYAVVLASVGLAYATLFQWLSLATLRLLHADLAPRARFQVAVVRAFLKVAALAVAGAIVAALLEVPGVPPRTVLLGAFLLVAQAWYELNLMVQSADAKPLAYGAMAATRSTLTLMAGSALALAGFGPEGVLAGAALGFLVPGVAQAVRAWPSPWRGEPAQALELSLLRYGAPLVATYMLDFVVSSSDRLLLGGLAGTAAAGGYAAAYDLTQQSLWTLLMIVNLAAYPVAVAARESGDAARFAEACRRHLGLLAALAFPAATGLIVLAAPIGRVVLGAEMGPEAAALIPVITLAVVLGGLKAYYFDLSFQLGRATLNQLWIAAATASLNVVLNVLWIPSQGGRGAALATLCAYALGLLLSIALGRRGLVMPVVAGDLARVLGAALGMAALLWPFRDMGDAWGLALVVLGGGASYLALLLALNPLGVRQLVLRRAGAS